MKKQIRDKRIKLVTGTYMKEAIKYKHMIINENNEYCITIKKYEEMIKPITFKDVNYVENGSYLVECTPLYDNYNIRFYVSKDYELIDFYVDITYENGLMQKVPYYVDLYLDIVDRHDGNGINFVDEEELLEALNNGLISKKDYNFAYKVGKRIYKEVIEHTNMFMNMDIVKLVKESNL
jgi:predicted RNA-binding protein associated with RNAse of E/G family